MSVYRVDFGTVRNVERTPVGGLRVNAAVTRAGVLTYKDTSGKEWRELRPESEVFKADSLGSLPGAAVTDGHPNALVTPDTFRAVNRGHVDGAPTREDALVVTPLAINDGDLVRAVNAGERKDVSAGYTCDLEEAPGVHDGERYDRVQRNIKYNHVALLPAGAGRAGPDVSLRMDGAAVHVRTDAEIGFKALSAKVAASGSADDPDAVAAEIGRKKLGQAEMTRRSVAGRKTRKNKFTSSIRADGQMEMIAMGTKIKFNGREYRTDDAGDMAAMDADVTTQMSKKDADNAALSEQLDAAQAALMSAFGTIANLKAAMDMQSKGAAEPDGDEADETEAAPEEVLDSRKALRVVARSVLPAGTKLKGMRADAVKALVSASVDTLATARAEEMSKVRGDALKVLAEADIKGKSTNEVRKLALAKLAPEVKLDSLDEKMIAGMFAAAIAAAKPAEKRRDDSARSHASLNETLNRPRTDADDTSAERAYADARKEAEARGRRSLNGSAT